MEFGPTPTHGSRNGLSLYAGLERLDQQPGRALLSRANHQPPPPFGKIKLCLTLTTGPFPLSRKWACRSQKGADSSGITFSVENLRCWFGAHKIDLICQKIKKPLFHLKNQIKYSNFEKISRFV
jgi:hypothetical protein